MWRCDYRTHVLTISYIVLVIFAHVAQARVGEENFQYTVWFPMYVSNFNEYIDYCIRYNCIQRVYTVC